MYVRKQNMKVAIDQLNLGCHVDVCMYVPLLIHEGIIELLSAAVSKNVKS